MRRTVSAVFIVLSIVTAFAAFGVPVNTSWTYQGQLRRSGAAYNGSCDFQFSLWDAASAGTQKASTLSINGVSVVNGLFTVTLDFEISPIGEVFFAGDARWLATSVQCSGDGGFTPLDPRQAITATPYALSLRQGATIDGSEGLTLKLTQSSPGPEAAALVALNNGSGYAVYAYSEEGSAIHGVSRFGHAGKFDGSVDIKGGSIVRSTLTVTNPDPLQTSTAIEGNGANGVYGVSSSPTFGGGYGVFGRANGANSAGVYGLNYAGPAIYGQGGEGPAIFGENSGPGYAGRFAGHVLVEGNLIVAGTLFKNAGAFRIDHPLDPANKFLSHSFVESPDMKNIYDGNVTTDASGRATITLPDYFDALNRDYRYQLTVLGQFAQAIVSREIAGNSFEIQTDKPGVKVSWQVTGIRQDAYARENPIEVEEVKQAAEQGLYLYPAGFGAGEEKRLGAPSRPTAPETEQKVTKKTK